eukprot:9639492-Lingulodinium_polyedra.AAC.1
MCVGHEVEVVEDVGKKERVIRARLTVRGFKDLDKDELATYVGAASHWGQRLIVAAVVQARWHFLTVVIEKAVLRGMIVEEMSEAAHSTETKDVNFELPGGSVSFLQQVPGFEHFNPQLEVLHCDKPGTGLRDAPVACSRKII